MRTSKFVATARRLIREEPEIYEALAEFERTRKLPKLKRKTRANFTIDQDLYRAFRTEAQCRGLEMSALPERMIAEQLREWRREK